MLVWEMNDADSGQDTDMHMDGLGGSRMLPTSLRGCMPMGPAVCVPGPRTSHAELTHMGTPESGWRGLKNGIKEFCTRKDPGHLPSPSLTESKILPPLLSYRCSSPCLSLCRQWLGPSKDSEISIDKALSTPLPHLFSMWGPF